MRQTRHYAGQSLTGEASTRFAQRLPSPYAGNECGALRRGGQEMSRNPFGVRWISAAALAACLAFGGATAAQAEEGAWYIGANMPLMFIDDSDSTSTTTFRQGPTGDQTTVYGQVGTRHGIQARGRSRPLLGFQPPRRGRDLSRQGRGQQADPHRHRLARRAAAADPSWRCGYPGVGFGQSARGHGEPLVRLRHGRHVDPLYRRRTPASSASIRAT